MNVGPDLNFAGSDLDRNGSAQSNRVRASLPKRRSAAASASPHEAPPAPTGFSVDVGSLLGPAIKRWPLLLIGTVLGAAFGAWLGLSMFKESFTATAKLERYVPPLASNAYNPQPLTVPTLVHIIQSPEFFLRVGRKLNPPRSGAEVAGRLMTVPERNTEILSVIAAGAKPEEAVRLANLYTEEVVAFAKEAQRREAIEAEGYVAQHLKETEADLEKARKDMPVLAPQYRAMLDAPGSALPTPDRPSLKLQSAQEDLAALLAKFTDAHPQVRQKRAEIAALEAQADLNNTRANATHTETPTTASATSTTPTVGREEWELAFLNVRELQNLRTGLLNRQHAIDLFKANPPGNFRVEMPAAMDNVTSHRARAKIILLAVVCGLIGFSLAAGEMLGREFLDNRLKTAADVTRVTGLPVISTLGHLRTMPTAEQENWAFHTWIKLQDRLSFSPNHGLICGVVSSRAGDGRSTWINLLAGAARKCGFRVLTIATKAADAMPVEPNGQTPKPAPALTARAGNAAVPSSTALASVPSTSSFGGDSAFSALTASALFTPAVVTEKLMGPESDPLVHIPLPGWTWNLERRKQWQSALNVWREIENVVILVELPPAALHESVLLATNLPNILWLSDAGKSTAPETRTQLETLRHARCNLVGAVLNRAPTPATHGRFSRWVGCLLPFVAALTLAGNSLVAGEDSRPPAAAEANREPGAATFSLVSPQHRAEWQRRFTLGPGDLLTLSIYGEPGATREDLPIGPDGRISYLEAQNVIAAGYTVDELRDRLNSELGKFRREPQVFIIPVAYKSKKYYVLGKVAERGVFPLDRPMTLIEAVARARGVETGIAADRSLVELADLSRAFIARRGQHLRVDFQKLFQEGDLAQNVALEPDDYIYLPTAGLKEIYVLGAVTQPGAYTFTGDVGVVGAIAARGGFTDRAWKKRLLVIRGSLGHPETFVVDAADVLAAKARDLRLQPRDIVFVSDRPWARAEDILDIAASAFVTSATVLWTGIHVNGLDQ